MTLEEKRKAIILFMRKKAEEISRLTNDLVSPEEYFNDEDEEEIAGWPEDDVEFAFQKLDRTTGENDCDWCPWCALYFGSCESCGYGHRHGVCAVGDNSNSYGSIVYEVGRDVLISLWSQAKEEVQNEG